MRFLRLARYFYIYNTEVIIKEMKTIKNIITILTLTAGTIFAQNTYTWVGGTSGSWAVSSNWSPARTLAQTSDIMVFSTGSQINITNAPLQTIGQLVINNNTRVTLTPASGSPKTLWINGGTGEDLTVESGSSLTLYSSDTRYGIVVKTGATALIDGIMTIRGSQGDYIDGADAGSVVFNNGSVLNQLCPGNIFTNAGTANAVVFKSGSVFVSNNAGALSPFALTAPASKVVFETGSTYSQQNSTMPADMFSGRNYANLEFDMNVNIQYSEAMTSDVTIRNLTVKNGSSFTFTNTNSAYAPSINIKGNLDVNGSFSIADNPNNKLRVLFNGSVPQSISGNGTIGFPQNVEELGIENQNGLVIEREITSGCPVTVTGKLELTSHIITGSVTVTPSGVITRTTGYVNGKITKTISASNPAATFEIGTVNGYSPVTLTFVKVQNSRKRSQYGQCSQPILQFTMNQKL